MNDLIPMIIPIIILAFITHKLRMWNNKKNEEIEYLASIKNQLLEETKQLKQVEETPIDNSLPTKQELMKSLNFMFQCNIIDHNQYNTLLIKALPYTKG